MVHMHPRQIPADIPYSEKLIFQALQASEGADDWHAFHSVKLNKISDRVEGEADFIIMIPGQGIVVIEAKAPEAIVSDADGWHLVGVPKNKLDPITQLEKIKTEVTGYLSSKHILFPTARLLWLTTLEAKDLAPLEGDIDVDTQEILTSSDFVNTIGAIEDVLSNFSKRDGVSKILKSGSEFVADNFKTACSAIEQHFVARASKTSLTEFQKNQLDDSEFDFMSVYDMVKENPNVYFNGAAGTGKSGYLGQFARDSYEEFTFVDGKMTFSDNKVLLLSWGVMIAESNRSKFKAYENMHVYDFGELMMAVTGLNPKDFANSREFWDVTLPKAAIAEIPNGSIGNYDLIAIDEFQDVATRPLVIDLVRKLAKDPTFKTTRLIVGSDWKQQILALNDESKVQDPFLAAKSLAPDMVHVRLLDNYRNSEEVGQAIESILGADEPVYRSFKVQGLSNVELVPYDSTCERTVLLDAIRELRQTTADADIRILSRYAGVYSLCGRIKQDKNPTDEIEASAYLYSMLKDEDVEGGFIGWRSIAKFKGRESHAVVITDVNVDQKYMNDPAAKQAAIKRVLESLYVGVSRANYRVKILCDKTMFEVLKEMNL